MDVGEGNYRCQRLMLMPVSGCHINDVGIERATRTTGPVT